MYRIIDQTMFGDKAYVEEIWLDDDGEIACDEVFASPAFDTYQKAEDYQIEQILNNFAKKEEIMPFYIIKKVKSLRLNIDFDPNDFGLCQSLHDYLLLLGFQIMKIIPLEEIPKGMTLEQFEQFAERLNELKPFA